ncbi:hypothetical protein MJO29_001194 [Puccinia striiformis f. sp. tritici]|nr:hypothetical protein MJO29_001194 [Puccinia striiformis f. sp. tritici]
MKGPKSNLQSAIKSPPARSSSHVSNRVPPQSALKAKQSHQPLRPIELAFEVGDIFQVKGEYAEADGSVWLNVMSPVSGLRGIVPLHKFRILGLPGTPACEQPNRLQSGQQSTPHPQSDHGKFLHSRSLQRFRKRLSTNSISNNSSFKSPPPTPREETPGSHSESFPFPSVDLHQFPTDPSPARGRQSISLTSKKAPDSPGPRAISNSRVRFLSQSCQSNTPSPKQKSALQLEPLSQLKSCAPLKLLYGVVKYSFTGEAEHELDAQAGEPITINAYSGDFGWFVCKPITRLGGPGLLPVSHVQIRDVATGMELSHENVESFVRSSGLPRVDEWKEATAAYLNCSIPLGLFETPEISSPLDVLPTVTFLEPSHASQTDLPSFPPENPVLASSELVRAWQIRQMEDTPPVETVEPPDLPTPSPRDSVDQPGASYSPFIDGYAESLIEAQGELWFTLKVELPSNDPDQSGNTLAIHRSYEELLKFDRALQSKLRIMSETAAEELQMPWLMEHVSVKMVDQMFYSYQVDELTGFLEQLAQASLEIRELREVFDFLGPRQDDLELEENMAATELTGEDAIIQYLDEMAITSKIDDQIDNFHKYSPSASQYTFPDRSTTSSVSDSFKFHSHYSSPSLDHTPSTPISPFPTKFKPCSSPLIQSVTKSFYSSDGQFAKMKICDLHSSDAIAIKVPNDIGLDELTTKIRNRHEGAERSIRLKFIQTDSLDLSCINFGDSDSSADYSAVVPPHLGSGTFVQIDSDAQLRDWMATEEKFVLYI